MDLTFDDKFRKELHDAIKQADRFADQRIAMDEKRPFYWVAPSDTQCAPTGWYQWKTEGIVYLGPSIEVEPKQTDNEFVVELEKRPMSTWSDEEMIRYSVLTGQANGDIPCGCGDPDCREDMTEND